MLKHFELKPFLAGLVAGYIIFFVIKPESRERVIKWPRPENDNKTVYRDRNGLCYTFESQLADCEKVKEKLQAYTYE